MSPAEKAGSWLADLADKLREDLGTAEAQVREAKRELDDCRGAEPDQGVTT